MQTNKMIAAALALLATGVAGFSAGRTTSQPAPLAQLGKEHKWLASLAGEYTAKMGGMMGESDGASRTESALGGLWNVTHYEGTLMNQPFKGLEIFGYDPVKKKYVAVWVDSMTPILLTTEGTYDADTKTLTMKGQSVGMDGEQAEMVNVTRFSDSGQSFAMKMESEPAARITIDYTRR